MATLKTFTMNLDGIHNVLVAAKSKAAAAELFKCSTYQLTTYGSEASDEEEVLALSAPGQVFRQKGIGGKWEPWTPDHKC